MTQMPAPGQRPATCPWCKTTLLPLASTDKIHNDAYCPRCPWDSRAINALPLKPRKPHNLRPPIRAAGHLAQRQCERNRWLDTEPVADPDREPPHAHPSTEDIKWTTTDRVLMGAAAVFIAAAIAIKHWPI